MVGDSFQADIEGAQAAGIPAILVRSRHPESGLCCEGLAELPSLIALEVIAGE
jgi:FMN phosphatase YigB (HAD superfamily)